MHIVHHACNFALRYQHLETSITRRDGLQREEATAGSNLPMDGQGTNSNTNVDVLSSLVVVLHMKFSLFKHCSTGEAPYVRQLKYTASSK